MHSLNVVHGDLKAVSVSHASNACAYLTRLRKANILINNQHQACLTDFGLATVLHNTGTFTASGTAGGTFRWMSPELLVSAGDTGMPTAASDIYALAMVFWEVSWLMNGLHLNNVDTITDIHRMHPVR